MPGKTAKVTITERQHDLLETITRPPPPRLNSASVRPSSSGPSRSGTTRRSPPQSGCRGGRSAPGDDVGPMPGSGSSASSAPRPTPRCAGPSSRSSAMSPAPAPPASHSRAGRGDPGTGLRAPEKSGRPITHWTAKELADEAIKRGIVPSISVTQVGRYLREAALQPHKKRYWLTPRERSGGLCGAGPGGL